MFDPVLRHINNERCVYSVTFAFRVPFILIVFAIFYGIFIIGEGPLIDRINIIILLILCMSLYAILFVDRWIFDKGKRQFEKHTGVIFIYSRKVFPLESLQKVLFLYSAGDQTSARSFLQRGNQGRVALSLLDNAETVHELGIVSGSSIKRMQKTAEQLAIFCEIPLELNDDEFSAD